jgi:ADP-ribosylglycohydrolase
MALAELDSIIECRGIDLKHIMDCFVRWYRSGEYTPFGYAFDIGNTVQRAISRYCRDENPFICGGTSESDNGNGSLMRIMPICLYCYQKGLKGDKIDAAIQIIHDVSGLTHNHLRSKIACGLYYFIVCEILDGTGNLTNRLQSALNRGFAYYQSNAEATEELNRFSRIRLFDQQQHFRLRQETQITYQDPAYRSPSDHAVGNTFFYCISCFRLCIRTYHAGLLRDMLRIVRHFGQHHQGYPSFQE